MTPSSSFSEVLFSSFDDMEQGRKEIESSGLFIFHPSFFFSKFSWSIFDNICFTVALYMQFRMSIVCCFFLGISSHWIIHASHTDADVFSFPQLSLLLPQQGLQFFWQVSCQLAAKCHQPDIYKNIYGLYIDYVDFLCNWPIRSCVFIFSFSCTGLNYLLWKKSGLENSLESAATPWAIYSFKFLDMSRLNCTVFYLIYQFKLTFSLYSTTEKYKSIHRHDSM